MALGLDYEEVRGVTGESDPWPGPSSVDIFPLGIVLQCVKLAQRDIYDDGKICLYALEIIERLARIISEEDKPIFRQQLHEADAVNACRLVRRPYFPVWIVN